jgi:hypothetical protein
VTCPDRISSGLRLASLSLPYAYLCIFIDLSCHVVSFSRGFLLRFWHSLHIFSHSVIFIVSFIILVSLCAFRILEYLLIEILCMKNLLCLCARLILIYLCLMNCCIAYMFLCHSFECSHKYHIVFGTNLI